MNKECPVKNTCPSIDSAIRLLQDALTDLNDAMKESEPDDIKWEVEMAHGRIANIDLEELRDQNAKLREWGEELYSEVEEIENYVQELESLQGTP